jgi:DNA-directed RNA polymerase subunit K/omega
MSDDIKSRAQGLDASARPRNVDQIAAKTTNIYESLSVISHRARQLSVQLKKELQGKLEEFSSATDSLEEVNENKEQIEISKFYERLPNPVTIAIKEFMEDELTFRRRDETIED